LVNALHLLTLCRLAVRLAHLRFRHHYTRVQEEPCCSCPTAHAVATLLSGYVRLVA
jgi:hypothetical protein